MVDNMLGEQLYNSGWHQGVLLPQLPYSVVYRSDDPVSKIARKANRHQTEQRDTQVIAGLPFRGIRIGLYDWQR